ncbi:MAG: hypothetical protein AAGI67_18845 [Pseudomonadota bacterium]
MMRSAGKTGVVALAMACWWTVALAEPSSDDGLTLAGLKNIQLVDAGSFVVAGKPGFAREETFEFLRRPDGGMTLLSATTLRDGSLRVQTRYDYDADWNALRAIGAGIYEDEPVTVLLEAKEKHVAVSVRGESTSIDETVPCPDGCFMDMGPSGSPMFVMTERYDHQQGGTQTFRWAAQDLRRAFTSPDNQRAELTLLRELPVVRAGGSTVTIREYDMVERVPTPQGGDFVLEFNLWTDGDGRPMGYRINTAGGKPSESGVLAFRKGFEDVRESVIAARP